MLSIELFVRRVSAHVCSTGNLTMLVASGMKAVSSMLFDLESVEPEEVEHTVPCWPAVQEVQRLVLEASESVCQVCVGLYTLCLLHGSVLRSSTELVPCWAETQWLLVCGLEQHSRNSLVFMTTSWWPTSGPLSLSAVIQDTTPTWHIGQPVSAPCHLSSTSLLPLQLVHVLLSTPITLPLAPPPCAGVRCPGPAHAAR